MHHRAAWGACLWLVTTGTALASEPPPEQPQTPPTAWMELALPETWAPAQASWYSARFEGKRTASGEAYRGHVFSAAHRSLPLGTLITVRNPDNQREVVVRVNDRGPHNTQRDIDLSQAAARALGILQEGVAAIEWQLAPPGASPTPPLRQAKTVKMASAVRHVVPPQNHPRRQRP